MKRNRKFMITAILLLIVLQLSAVKIPRLTMMVTDNAQILNRQQENRLEGLLRSVKQSTSAEIALLTVKDMGGLTIEDYSIRVVDNWKLGKADRDNGVLLLVSTGDRKVRLEIGYGLEDIVTDAKSSYIINTMILPSFRDGDYYSGIEKGLAAVGGLINETYVISAEELAKYQRSEERSKKSGGIPVGLIIFILFIVLSGRRRGGLFTWLLLGSMMGGGRSGNSGGFGSGGGFGGFSGGGGGFGGGGASGGW